ncbi:Zinc finger HIT domain-containing protein 3 [Mactra antiquata]
MIKKPICEICKENEHKYRCPQCRIVYCSLGCYKTHKDDCVSIKPEQPKTEPNTDVLLTEKILPEYELNDEETEDKVNIEQLEELRNCEELKEMLGNPHLRQMMTSLVHADKPGPLLEKAMQEPIFTEFADTCLSIIENKDDET